MSGGYFEYNQYIFNDVAGQIDRLIAEDSFDDIIMDKFKEASHWCKRCAEMVQRIDWLIEGDDGPETFLSRWDKEVRPRHERSEL